MKLKLFPFLLLCGVLFLILFFSDDHRRTQTLTVLAGPGMLSLVSQSPDTTPSGLSMYRTTASSNSGSADSFSTESPRIALTFDDGPNARYTPLLLNGLRERKILASFFLIGKNIEGNEDTLRQMQKDGHLIGNHTWNHIQLNKVSAPKARLEIEKTNNRIYEATGIYPSYVRPPFGAWGKDMELSVSMLPVFWDVDTLDWKNQNTDCILSIARKEVHDGSVILMHDAYPSSVEAALLIADFFTEKGYEFVTVDKLLVT